MHKLQKEDKTGGEERVTLGSKEDRKPIENALENEMMCRTALQRCPHPTVYNL